MILSFIVFAPGPLVWAPDLTAEGSPSRSLPEGLTVRRFDRDSAPELVAWAEPLVAALPEPERARLAASRVWYEVGGSCPSAADLSALQAAWAAARALCRAGAIAVWDALAARWTFADDALTADPQDPRLAAAWELNTLPLEGVSEDKPLFVVFTMGLHKFGRQDLVAFGPAQNLDVIQSVVCELAIDLAEGAVLQSGWQIEKGGVWLEAVAYAPGFNGPPAPVPFFGQPLLLMPS
jgi:hypothetical protein